MSDLISRSALLKAFAEKTPFGCGTIGIKFVDELIKAQPTAYDVEKVVADLEKEKEIHTEHYNISIYKDFPEIKSRYKQIQGVINKAIDIVKRGGIE